MKMVEKMARAMRESDRKCAPGNWNEWPQAKQAHRDGYMRRAAVALNAMSEPTGAMLDAGAEHDGYFSHARVFSAMIKAAIAEAALAPGSMPSEE